MIKIEAARRLLASSWQGRMEIALPTPIDESVREVLNRLCHDYPTLAHIDVKPGDPEILEAQGALATKSNNALYLHPQHWLSEEKLKAHEKEWSGGGLVDPSSTGVIIHECGHILYGQVMDKIGAKKFNALVGKHIRDFSGIYNDEAPSAYGQENLYEFLAEAFVAHYLGRVGWETHNDISVRALQVCKAIWADFDKVLH